jgi:hypothetical protein
LLILKFRICYISVAHVKNLKIKRYRFLILLRTEQGRENWSLSVNVKHRARMNEEEVTGKLRKLQNKELHWSYYSSIDS